MCIYATGGRISGYGTMEPMGEEREIHFSISDPETTELPGTVWDLPTDLGSIESASETFMKRLEPLGWPIDATYWMDMALREALANAIFHGNLRLQKPTSHERGTMTRLALDTLRDQPELRNKKVHVEVTISEDSVEVTVQDEGPGYPPEVIAAFEHADIMAETGRGIDWMRKGFDTVDIAGNKVTMRKKRPS